MTVVAGTVKAYHVGGNAFSFNVGTTTYGIPLTDSAFSPPPTVSHTYEASVVQCNAILTAYLTGAEVTFDIGVAADGQLSLFPPGSDATDPSQKILCQRAFNIDQERK